MFYALKNFGRTSLLSSLLFAVFMASGCRPESGYPNRPILLICPWSAGGGTDRVSRQVAAQLEREIGVPVNVINATGGAGVTGHTRGALARPDGYTLTMTTVELNMLHWRGLTSISYEDYRPVVLLNRDAAALFVRSEAPWKTPAELAAEIEAKQGELNASGTARGGIWHLALAGWLMEEGLKPTAATWISINGAAPSLQELMAGGVETVCCSLPEAKSLLDSGRIRCLGVMADERLAQFPDVPTFKEKGIDWSVGGWRGICLPKETPAPIAEQITAAVTTVVQSEEFRRFMREAGFNWDYEGPEEFRASLEEMDEQFGELLTSEEFQSMGRQNLGPMFFPSVLAILGGIVLVVLLASGALKTDPEAGRISKAGWIHVVEVMVWVGAYVILVEWVGFVITGIGMLVLLMLRLRVNAAAALAVSVVLVPILYQIFAVSLRVSLPRGWLGW